LNFPNQSSTASSGQFAQVINQVKSDQDELNRQVFSLLTFGSFIPVNTFDNSGNSASDYGIASTVNSSLSSFISNQVTSWIAQSRLGEKGWELGVDWENNSNLTDAQKSELVVSVRKQLLNERLEFSGSLDAIENNNGSNPWNVNLVYRINKEGNLKLRAYRRMANDPTLGQISNTTTTGLGFYYRKQFNKLNWFNKDKPD
jgi:translocation and assembly module TamB